MIFENIHTIFGLGGPLFFLLIGNSLMHKSKAGHGEEAMVRIDRKCEAHV